MYMYRCVLMCIYMHGCIYISASLDSTITKPIKKILAV